MADEMGDYSLDTQTLAGIKMMASSAPAQNANAPPDEDTGSTTRRRVSGRHQDSASFSPPPAAAPPARYPLNIARRAPGLVGHVIPRLTPARTVPSKPSRREVSQPKMFNSFAGFDDGDTQVMDSQIYKTFRGSLTSHPMEGRGMQQDDNGVPNGTGDGENTLEEGDTGHVDLIGEWHGSEQGEPMNMSGDEDNGTSPETQMLAGPVSNAQFIPPETPALGRKRNNRGEIISSDTRTPGTGVTAKLFNNGSGAPMLSLSQMFRPTQAASSPQIDGQRSDPLFTRPSPNLHMRFSSPSTTLSSPIKTLQSDQVRAATEPREEYISMKESQEMREKQMRARYEIKRQHSNEIDVFEEWLMTDDAKAAERDLIREFDAQAVVAAKRERNQNRRGRGYRGRATMSDTALMTPARSLAKERDVVDISDDGPGYASDESYDGIPTEPPTVEKPQDETAEPTTNGVQVPMTSSRREGSLGIQSGQREPSQSTRLRQSQVPPEENGEQHQTQERVLSSNHRSQRGTQNIAVADSQPPGDSVVQDSAAPPRSHHPSSLDSNTKITQSQYSTKMRKSASQQVQEALNTSSVPRPPELDGTQEDADDQVPSSPPIVSPPPEALDEGMQDVPDTDAPELPDTDEEVDLIGGDDDYDKPDLEQEELEEEPDSSPSRTSAQRLSQRSGHTAAAQPDGHREEAAMVRPQPGSAERGKAASARPPSQSQKAPEPNAPVQITNHRNNPAQDSHETRLFSTARTRMSTSTSPRKSQKTPKKSQKSPKKSQRTPASTRIRRLADIAAGPAEDDGHDDVDADANGVGVVNGVDDGIGIDDIDLDIDLLTDADRAFIEATTESSPVRPAKRRKVYSARKRGRERSVGVGRVDGMVGGVEGGDDGVGEVEGIAEGVVENGAETVPEDAPEATAEAAADAVPEAVSEAGPHVLPETRAVTRPAGTPVAKKPGKLSHPSTKLHRQALSTWTENHRLPGVQPEKGSPAVQPEVETPQRRPKVKEVAESPVITPSKATNQQTPSLATSSRASRTTAQRSVNMPPSSAASTADTNETVIVTERVLALFKGTNMAYYPATCIGSKEEREGSHVRVRFDDGTVTFLELHHVRRLVLHKDDLVRVDLPKMRTKTYIVRGLKDKIDPPDGSTTFQASESTDVFPLTDVHGYKTVILEVKRRDSFTSRDADGQADTIDIPIASIYITGTMWPRFNDRPYTPRSLSTSTRLRTPSLAPDTPSSKSRSRAGLSMGTSIQRTASASVASASLPASDLFAGMAFAVTFTSAAADAERDNITALIAANGGRLLDPGFEVLFRVHGQDAVEPSKTPVAGKNKTPQPNSFASKTSSTSKAPSHAGSTTSHPDGTEEESESSAPFTLHPSSLNLGFTALISDRHSRRAKYMQALALGLPCLSSRWVRDCVRAGAVLGWDRYLLPAGESAFLGGAVRSRTLAPYDPLAADAGLAAVVGRRERLLDCGAGAATATRAGEAGKGGGVIIIMGRGRVEERRRAYLFLTFALGARRVERVRDLEAARRVLQRDGDGDGGWDWVYVDGGVREARVGLFGDGGGEEAGEGKDGGKGRGGGKGKGRRPRVVGDEFVIQSLILGALIEEE